MATTPPAALTGAEAKRLLADLAGRRPVSAAAPHQAFNALRCLFRHVLTTALGDLSDTPRATRRKSIPTVRSRQEVERLLAARHEPDAWVARLMSGCGVRRSEATHLRLHQCYGDTGMRSIPFGTGGTSRTVPLPKQSHGAIMRPVEQVRALHQADLKRGDDGVFLPASFAQQATSAARDLVWQGCCPAPRLTRVEATRDVRRDHGHDPDRQRAIKAAARQAGMPTRVSPHTRRPTCATHLWQAHDDLRQMPQRLGHRDGRTTMIDTPTITFNRKP
jgi:integrase